jgi:hypothetical protein
VKPLKHPLYLVTGFLLVASACVVYGIMIALMLVFEGDVSRFLCMVPAHLRGLVLDIYDLGSEFWRK